MGPIIFFRNVGKELQLHAAWYPRREQVSVPKYIWLLQKTQIRHKAFCSSETACIILLGQSRR